MDDHEEDNEEEVLEGGGPSKESFGTVSSASAVAFSMMEEAEEETRSCDGDGGGVFSSRVWTISEGTCGVGVTATPSCFWWCVAAVGVVIVVAGLEEQSHDVIPHIL